MPAEELDYEQEQEEGLPDNVIPFPGTSENNETMQKEMEEEQFQNESDDTNKKLVEAGVKVAATAFAGPAGAKVAELASKTRFGQEILGAAGNTLSNVTNNVPGGKAIQGGLNDLNKAGVVDAASSAASAISGGASAGDAKGLSSATGASKLELPEGYEPEGVTGGGQGAPQSGSGDKKDALNFINKKKIIMSIIITVAPYVAAFLIIVVILSFLSPNAGATLDLTNGSYNEGNMVNSQGTYTDEQIESMLTYVGDSRIIGLENAINKSDIKYIAEVGMGYNWFISEGQSLLDVYLGINSVKFVVFNFGINDLANIDRYINLYNSIIANNNNIKFYFMSVNPVDEVLGVNNGYTVTNAEIESFNTRLKEAFGENYIDVYTPIKSYFSSTDGIHYDDKTYQEIHRLVLDYIKSKNVNEYGESVTPDYSEDLGPVAQFGTSAAYPTMSPVRGKYGSFPYNDAPAGRNITIDPRWVDANIISINFPCSEISSPVRIHKLAKPNFDAAFTNICKLITGGINGIKLSTSDINLNGAYVSRKTSSGAYSLHGYGLAIDLNVTLTISVNGSSFTPYMSQGTATYNEYQSFVRALGGDYTDPRNVNYVLWKYAFEPAGFNWGGDWSAASFDPMHYEVDWSA